MAVPPRDDGLTISGVGSDGFLKTRGQTWRMNCLRRMVLRLQPGEVVIPAIGPAPRGVHLELVRALLLDADNKTLLWNCP